MKKFAVTVLVLAACWCLPAFADETAPSALERSATGSEKLFDEHLRTGTLFRPSTREQFRKKGWRKEYVALIRQKWDGKSHDGVGVELRGLPDHVYRVGEQFDCVATITNDGERPQRINTGGDCGMTHSLGLFVIPPDDEYLVHSCRPAGFGPHCFCVQTHQSVSPGNSAKLATGFGTAAASGWVFNKPGEYAVIGMYLFRSEAGKPTHRAYSPLLIVTVKKRAEPVAAQGRGEPRP